MLTRTSAWNKLIISLNILENHWKSLTQFKNIVFLNCRKTSGFTFGFLFCFIYIIFWLLAVYYKLCSIFGAETNLVYAQNLKPFRPTSLITDSALFFANFNIMYECGLVTCLCAQSRNFVAYLGVTAVVIDKRMALQPTCEHDRKLCRLKKTTTHVLPVRALVDRQNKKRKTQWRAPAVIDGLHQILIVPRHLRIVGFY